MWIRNTSRHPDARVRRLVRFAAAEVDMDGVCVNVKNGALGGGAYNGVPEISNAPGVASTKTSSSVDPAVINPKSPR